jgi:hypothetical protein
MPTVCWKSTSTKHNNFSLGTFNLYVATFQQHLHIEYISLSWYDITELVVPIRISLIKDCWKEKVQNDKQWSTKHTHKTKDRVTRTPLKNRGELRCSGRVSSSCSTSDTRRVNLAINRYNRACGSYQDFLDKGLLLTRKLLNQGFPLVKLKSSLRKFYGLHHDLVDRYGISVSQMTTDMFHLPNEKLKLSFLS